MDDPSIFYLGVFVMALFISGLLFTFREFKTMNEENQRKYRADSVKIDKGEGAKE